MSATRESGAAGGDLADIEPFAHKMNRLAARWRTQQAKAGKLDSQIEANLQSLGFRRRHRLAPLFAAYFEKLGLPNLMLKRSFYELAEHVPFEEIDPEVTEKLDVIVRVASGGTAASSWVC